MGPSGVNSTMLISGAGFCATLRMAAITGVRRAMASIGFTLLATLVTQSTRRTGRAL